jgi:hypothetical protein
MRLLTYQTADGPAAAIQVDETPADLVAWLSRTITLLPGDIIATGTPAGVGAAQGRFLRDGDTRRGRDRRPGDARQSGPQRMTCSPAASAALSGERASQARARSRSHRTKSGRLVGLRPRVCFRPKAQVDRRGGAGQRVPQRASNLTDGLRGSPASLSADRLPQRGQEPIKDLGVRNASRSPRFARICARRRRPQPSPQPDNATPVALPV